MTSPASANTILLALHSLAAGFLAFPAWSSLFLLLQGLCTGGFAAWNAHFLKAFSSARSQFKLLFLRTVSLIPQLHFPKYLSFPALVAIVILPVFLCFDCLPLPLHCACHKATDKAWCCSQFHISRAGSFIKGRHSVRVFLFF